MFNKLKLVTVTASNKVGCDMLKKIISITQKEFTFTGRQIMGGVAGVAGYGIFSACKNISSFRKKNEMLVGADEKAQIKIRTLFNDYLDKNTKRHFTQFIEELSFSDIQSCLSSSESEEKSSKNQLT
jgi:hypothetical protein